VVRQQADRARGRNGQQMTVPNAATRDAVANIGRQLRDEASRQIRVSIESRERPLLFRERDRRPVRRVAYALERLGREGAARIAVVTTPEHDQGVAMHRVAVPY